MAVTLIPQRHQLSATQIDDLHKLLVSSEFSLLKEVLVANCVIAQIGAMKALGYPDNSGAKEGSDNAVKDAIRLNTVLDTLDGLAENEDKWFTITIEPSR